jgi:hypothetical protein
MRTFNSSAQNPPTATNQAYSPSVPLSVYRDLAAELQAAQAMLDALTAKNQLLTEENQLLREEITKTIQSILDLQKVVQGTDSYNKTPHSSPDLRVNPEHRVKSQQKVKTSRRPAVSRAMEASYSVPEPVYIEEQEVRYYPSNKTKPKEVNSWLLIIAILFIILTAFVSGYVIVRPLLERYSR